MTVGVQGKKASVFDGRGFAKTIAAHVEEIQGLYCLDSIPWVVGYSGGKDSTAILQLVWMALRDLPVSKRNKKVYVISTDTLVESPVVSEWVGTSLRRMKMAAEQQNLPIESYQLFPKVEESFWVNLIGKGYPAPRHLFRWCTVRLKIQPSSRFIQDVVRSNGEAILVLGTRKAESTHRHGTFKKHEANRLRERLTPNANLPNSHVYTPIEDWSNDDVWVFLMQQENEWGHPHKDLLTMYRGASADGECPLVVDTSTPSCGSSRFGCWVCTLVDRDRSMEAMIQNDDEKIWMQPLLDIRNALDPRGENRKPDDRDKRDYRRMDGSVQLYERNIDGKKVVEPIYGPYTKEWREKWLRMVLEAQKQIRENGPSSVKNLEIIREDALHEIRRIWLTEKHEFDDALPRIYEDVLGEPFKTRQCDGVTLGPIEWDTLKEVCTDDSYHMELIARLLDTERKFSTMARRKGIYQSLENCFKISGFIDKYEAIEEAKRTRQLVLEGDVDSVQNDERADLPDKVMDEGVSQ